MCSRVGIRLLADSAYRPANLLSYLAEDTARVGKLPAAQQTSSADSRPRELKR